MIVVVFPSPERNVDSLIFLIIFIQIINLVRPIETYLRTKN